MDMKMKTCLGIFLLNWFICEVFSEIEKVPFKTTVSTDVESPITTTTVSLQLPYCYFDSVLATLCPKGTCIVGLAIALTSGPGKSNFDTIRKPVTYTEAFTPTGPQYFAIMVPNQPACPAVSPLNLIVGAAGACTNNWCNGALPEGRDMSFKFFLWLNQVIAETSWSDSVRLLAPTFDIKPVVSTDVSSPITINTVSLQMPYCYFDNVTAAKCPDKSKCEVWLVSSLTSATSIYESSNRDPFLSEYPTAYTSNGFNFSMTLINTLDKITCPAEAPYDFLVGADGACSESYCNGFLPDGETMSFKYVLAINGDDIVDTAWSDSITLKARKSPDTLGSGYAGRSGSMVAITTILSIFTIVLSILLIGTLVLICGKKGKAN